jgi:hypothetical protein
LIGEFKRYTHPLEGDTTHRSINVFTAQDMIWAYNVQPVPTPSESWKIYHGINKGHIRLNFQTGSLTDIDVVSVYQYKINHGVGMFVTWILIFPFAIFWARYAKSVPWLNGGGWFWVHIVAQSVGSALCVIFML